MSKFKKRYNDTFNTIHAPDSIKQEVLTMARNLKQQQNSIENNMITTQVKEVSKGSYIWQNIATAIAVIGICFAGVMFFNKSADKISSSVGSDTSPIDSSYILGNSNFEDIFGVKLEDINPIEIVSMNGENPILTICTGNSSVIMNIIDSFNTTSWELSIPVDDNNINTQLNLDIYCSNSVTNNYFDISFYTLKHDKPIEYSTDDIYVHVKTGNIDNHYKVNNTILMNVSKAVEENNYIYFDKNPSNGLSVSFGTDDTFISDTFTIKSITDNLFNNFTWKFSNNLSINKTADIQFSQLYEGTSYIVSLFKYDSSLYATISCDTFNQNYSSIYELTSNSLEEDYQRLVDLIRGNNSNDNTFLNVDTYFPEDLNAVLSEWHIETGGSTKTSFLESNYVQQIDNISNTQNWTETNNTNLSSEYVLLAYYNRNTKQWIYVYIYSNGYVKIDKIDSETRELSNENIYATNDNEDFYNQVRNITIQVQSRYASNDTSQETISVNTQSSQSATTSQLTTVITTPSVTTVTNPANTITSKLETITTQTNETTTESLPISLDIQSIDMPYSALPANMKADGSVPLFLDWGVRSFFFSAYAIADNLDRGVSFMYSSEDFTIINERTYYKVPFDTLNELENYLRYYFTDSYIQNNNLMDIYIQLDDGVYFERNLRPMNDYYIGHTFYLDSVTDNKIFFHADAYYQNIDAIENAEIYTGSNFYSEEPTIPYATQVCNYVLVKTENGWKFDTLDVMY